MPFIIFYGYGTTHLSSDNRRKKIPNTNIGDSIYRPLFIKAKHTNTENSSSLHSNITICKCMDYILHVFCINWMLIIKADNKVKINFLDDAKQFKRKSC